MQESSSKFVQKTVQKGKKSLKILFFECLGHSEEFFDHKVGNFFGNCASGLVSSSGAFRGFFQPNFSNLK